MANLVSLVPNRRYREKFDPLWVFVSAALFFTICLALMPDSVREKQCSDCEGWYIPVAENLASGNGLVVGTNNRPALERPPGQVLLLSGLFKVTRGLIEKEIAIYAYNVALLSVAAVLLFTIGRFYWGTTGGLITTGLWVTCPFVLWFLNQPFSEVPFFVAVYAGVWFVIRAVNARGIAGWWLLVGVALGCATLIRPIGFALLLPLLIFAWLSARQHSKKLRAMGMFCAVVGYIAVLSPWHIYLWDQTRAPQFLSAGSHAHRSIVEGMIFGIRSEEYKKGLELHFKVREFMEEIYQIVFLQETDPELFERYGPNGTDDIRSTNRLLRIAGDHLFGDPELVARFVWLKISRSWYGTDSHNYENVTLPLQSCYLILLMLGSLGAWKRTRFIGLVILVWLVSIYFWVFSVMFTPLLRYMIPAVGLQFLLAPGALSLIFGPNRLNDRDVGLLHSSKNKRESI
jgi:4-amino-4-deoxy-L-arabinose transferase-like glycosyltransferase